MKKTCKLVLSLMLILSFVMSCVGTLTFVKADGEPYTVEAPSGLYGDFRLVLNKGQKFEWLKVYNTSYESTYDVEKEELVRTCNGEKALISEIQGNELNTVDADTEANTSYIYSIQKDYDIEYVKFEFKLENDPQTYTWEWNRPSLGNFKPVIHETTVSNNETDKGYYDITLSCSGGDDENGVTITYILVSDSDGNVIDMQKLTDGEDNDIAGMNFDEETQRYNIIYRGLLGGKSYKFTVKNEYGVLSDSKDTSLVDKEVPDSIKNSDDSSDVVNKKNDLSLKVSTKNKGDYSEVTVSTNRKCTIYVDGVKAGVTKKNKLVTNIYESGEYTIRAVDKNSKFKEKKITIKGLKYAKSKAPKVISREDWKKVAENGSKLPQTGTTPVITIVVAGLIVVALGILVYKKKGVRAK